MKVIEYDPKVLDQAVTKRLQIICQDARIIRDCVPSDAFDAYCQVCDLLDRIYKRVRVEGAHVLPPMADELYAHIEKLKPQRLWACEAYNNAHVLIEDIVFVCGIAFAIRAVSDGEWETNQDD